MNTREKRIFALSLLPFMTLVMSGRAEAMHIAEGMLSPMWAVFWIAVSLPFVVIAAISIKKKLTENPKLIVLLALSGAFAFVLSALKIPSVNGSCSHPTGVGLGAVLFGPFAMALISLIVLLFQALFLAHGGLTTIGANTFSMGIAGPFVSWAVYKMCRKSKLSPSVSVFFAAFLGDLVTYIVTSFQLAAAFPENGNFMASLTKFLGIFAVTQLPLAVAEGLLTVVIFSVLEKYSTSELRELRILEA